MAFAVVERFLNKSQFMDWPPWQKNMAVVERLPFNSRGSTVFGLKMFTGFNA